MLSAEPYDSTLTRRIRDEWAALDPPTEAHRESLRATLDRVETRIRALLPEPELARVLSLLHPKPPPAGTAIAAAGRGPPQPMSRSASEMIELSGQLDAADEPSRAWAIGEHVARRAHELAHSLESLLMAVDPGDPLSDLLHHLLAYASQLLRNALARIRQFGATLGVSSVSVTLSSLPPEFSISFTFGAG